MKVQFQNVGHSKKTWDAEILNLEHGSLFRAVKKAGALGSNGIEFEYDDVANQGDIYVGGFRHVGTFAVVREQKK